MNILTCLIDRFDIYGLILYSIIILIISLILCILITYEIDDLF